MPLPVFDNATYAALLAKKRTQDRNNLYLQGDLYGQQQSALGGDVSLLDARRRATDARLGTIGANAGVTMAQGGVNAANYGVLGADETQLGATRGLIGLEQQQAGAQAQDVSLIRAARANTADKIAVAQEQQYRNTTDKLDARLGVAAPINVDIAPGASDAGLGLGTRASLKTQEDIVRGQVADREVDRAATLENAKLAVSMQSTNVTEAELMARRAGLSLADARLLVDEAQTREALAGVDVSRAQNDNAATDISLSRSNIGLEQGKLGSALTAQDIADMKGAGSDQGLQLYQDPYSGEYSWKTPAEADQAQHDYEVSLTRSRLPESVSLATERTQATQKAAAAQNPFYYFDDSDYVNFIAQGVQGAPSSLDASQASFDRLVAQVRDGLMAKYGGNEQAVNTKLLQYVNAARALQARQQDSAVGLSR